MRAFDADVVVAGGGAVGMMLAAEFGLLGIRTILLESREEAADLPKAGTLHARTVQSLDRRGLLGEGAGRGGCNRAWFHFAASASIEIEVPESEGAPIIGLAQVELERILERRASALAVDIRRGHTVTDLVSHASGVELGVRMQDGSAYRLGAGWVLGCEGARSLIREAAGFTNTAWPASVRALLGRVRLADPFGVPAGWKMTRHGWLLFNIHPGGESRVVVFDFSGPDPKRQDALTADEFDETVAMVLGRPVVMHDHSFLSRFSDYGRLADQYRRGRVLLAGDAAHVHFPLGGQGLNLGMQDAFNLAWKLAAVIRGAPDALLDSYATERRPVAARVIENTRAQRAIMEPAPHADALRHMIGDMLSEPAANRQVANMISGQDIRYQVAGAQHVLEGGFAVNVGLDGVGGAADLASALHGARSVLVHPGEAPETLTKIASDYPGSVDLHQARGLRNPAMLVRPDGYIAWVEAGRTDDVKRLRTCLGLLYGAPRASASWLVQATTLSHPASA